MSFNHIYVHTNIQSYVWRRGHAASTDRFKTNLMRNKLNITNIKINIMKLLNNKIKIGINMIHLSNVTFSDHKKFKNPPIDSQWSVSNLTQK